MAMDVLALVQSTLLVSDRVLYKERACILSNLQLKYSKRNPNTVSIGEREELREREKEIRILYCVKVVVPERREEGGREEEKKDVQKSSTPVYLSLQSKKKFFEDKRLALSFFFLVRRRREKKRKKEVEENAYLSLSYSAIHKKKLHCCPFLSCENWAG